jgi:hypothetical protein
MRELIHTKGYDDDPRVREIDREVLKFALKNYQSKKP